MNSHEITYRNRRAVKIESDQLIVTVTVEGGHIAEILEKTTGVNPLWTPPWPSIEPSSHDLGRMPEYGNNSESKLLAGILGHNLCLDIFGAPSPQEYAAGLTVHGESSVVRYKIETGDQRLTARAHLPLALLDFEREIILEPGGVIRIRERVTNLTSMDRPIAWTQHVTLGPPFIEHGTTRLDLSARESMVFPWELGPHDQYQPGAPFTWPDVPRQDGATSDLSVFTSSDHSAGVTCHVVDRDRGFFTAWHPRTQLLFGYVWKRSDYPWISLWEENRSRTTPPWNGETIAWGVEFGVSPFAEGRRATIERGSLLGTPAYRWLPARGSASVEYLAFARKSSVPDTLLPV